MYVRGEGYDSLGRKNSVSKFYGKNIFVSDIGRKKYSESTLCLKRNSFLQEKNNVLTTIIIFAALRSKKIIIFAALRSKKIIFDSEKNP